MTVVPINDGFFTAPLEPLEQAQLRGSRCRRCGEVFFGKVPACGNCTEGELEEIGLSRRGKLFTFTTIWSRPPGDYKGPEPFQPYSVGLVQMPEGVRVLSPLLGREPDRYDIGADMELVAQPLYRDGDGREFVGFAFRQIGERE